MAKFVKRSFEQRQRLVEAYRKSGLPVHSFCKMHRIGTSTLLAWRREFPEKNAFASVVVEPTTEAVATGKPMEEMLGAKLVGRHGIVLEFAKNADAAWIAGICERLL